MTIFIFSISTVIFSIKYLFIYLITIHVYLWLIFILLFFALINFKNYSFLYFIIINLFWSVGLCYYKISVVTIFIKYLAAILLL